MVIRQIILAASKVGWLMRIFGSSKGGGLGLWSFFALMYLFTSETVEPIGKLEFFWRILAGPFNFLPV